MNWKKQLFRLMSFILSTVLIMSCVLGVSAAARGDLNSDGQINNEDVEYLLWNTLFPESYPLETDPIYYTVYEVYSAKLKSNSSYYYNLYDIDKDGIPELFMKAKLSMYDTNVYTCSNGTLKSCGIIPTFYSGGLYGSSDRGLIVHWGGMGTMRYEYVDRMDIQNGTLKTVEELRSTEMGHSYAQMADFLKQYTRLPDFSSAKDEALLKSTLGV